MATYNATIPLQTNSPSVFPAQSQGNFNRLQTIIGADHQFNLTAPAPPSNDGYHNLIHMTIQAPSGVLASTGRLYVKDVSGRINLFYMDDQATEYQITPIDTVLTGTVVVSSSPTYATLTAVPANTFGEIFMWKSGFIQAGAFVSDGSTANAYSYSEKYVSGSGASQILNLGFSGAGGSGLNIRVTNTSGSSFNGSWNYRIFYRSV